MNRSDLTITLTVLVFGILFVTIIGLMIRTSMQCYDVDGTVVRGLFWLECIK
jgi:hypothetical protein